MKMSASEQLQLKLTQVVDVFPLKCREPEKGQHISLHCLIFGRFKKTNKPLTIDTTRGKQVLFKSAIGKQHQCPLESLSV